MAVRHGYGKIAGADALVFAYDTGDTRNSYKGEPTVNLISSTGVDMSVLSTYPELIRNRVVDSASLSGYACEMEVGNAGNINASSRIQFGTATNIPTSGNTFISVWVKFQGGTFVNIIPRVYTGVNWYDMSPLDGGSPYLTSEYRRFGAYVPMGTASGGPNPGFSMTRGSDSIQTGQKTRWHSPQVEVKTHVTPFTTGTRSSTQGLLDLTGNSTIDLSSTGFDSNAQPVFDGTNNHMSVGTGILSGTGNFTVEAVIQSDYQEVNGTIFANYPAGNLQTFFSGRYIGLFLANNSTYLGSSPFTTVLPEFTTDPIHFLALREGTETRVYLNGVLKKTGSSSSTIGTTSAPFRVGANTNGTEDFLGQIFVVKAYNRALTPLEVRNNFNFYKGRYGI